MSVRERDPELVRFASRVSVVVGAVMLCAAAVGGAVALATQGVRDAQAQERRDRVSADSLRDARMDRLVAVVEVLAVLDSEPANSPRRDLAVDRLHAMLHLIP